MTTPVQLVIEGEDRSQGALSSASSGIAKVGQIALGIISSQVFTKLADGVLNFAKSTLTSAMESEEAIANLNATIQSTGGVAGVSADMATKLADSLQKVTRFGDETILNAESMLLTFTKIGSDVFPQATEAALNMAAKFKSDPTQAAIQLGKALNDPIAGVGALRRVGVALTEDQEKQIKKFMAVNDIASAQKLILGELETEFGGLARAMGNTFAGRMDILKNRFDEVKETIGTAIIPILEKMMDKFAPMIPIVEDFGTRIADMFGALESGGISGLIENLFGSDVAGKFNGFVANIKSFIDDGLNLITDWWSENGGGIMTQADRIFGGLQTLFQELSADIGPLMQNAFGKISTWFMENGPLIQAFIQKAVDVWTTVFVPTFLMGWNTMQPILSGLIDLILGLGTMIMQVATGDWAGAWETIKSTASAVFEALVQGAMNLISGLLGIFGTSVPEIAASISTGFQNAVTGVQTAFTNMKMAITTKMNEIKTSIQTKMTEFIGAIRGKLSSFVEVGRLIINSIKTGVEGAWNSFVDWITSAVQNIVNDILAALGAGGGESANTTTGSGGNGSSTAQSTSNTTNNRTTFNNYGTYINGNQGRGSRNLVDQFG